MLSRTVVFCSEDEARMKIYSVSTKNYYAFGALVSEELSYKLKELPHVRWVLSDSYLDVKNKENGVIGEPFINGQAEPYDLKYHEEWVRNNAHANERNRRNDKPRNNDRSRNFDRRPNYMPERGGPPGNMGGTPNMGAMLQNNVGAMQESSVRGVPNMGQMQNGNIGNKGGPSQIIGGMAPNLRGAPQRQTKNFEQRGMANNGGYSTNTPG